MSTTLLPPAQWAQQEFSLAELGDPRRTRRLVSMATQLAQSPSGTLPQALPEWSELKAAYRWLSQPQNTPEKIQAPHCQRTLQQCREPGEYLLIEDTSELDYTHHPATVELGTIGNGQGRGLLVHSTLAVRVEAWNLRQQPEGVALGLLGQHIWSRSGPSRRKSRERWRQRMQRPRESQRWAAVFEEIGGPPPSSRWIFLADREADFYEPIQRCQRHKVDFVIRAYHHRALADQEGHLQEAVAQAPVRGHLSLELRARPGQPARTATVTVRSCSLKVVGPWRPQGQQPDLDLNVVEVREESAPPGVEPLHWLLLTSLPCTRWVEVQRVVNCYAARWWVEEYHKALKTGTAVEESQLERAYRLETLVAVLSVIAVRLLNTKWLARTRGDQLVGREVLGPEALALLAIKFGKPKGGWTHRALLVAVARLGGFLARKGDGIPGWLTIWRGWQKLMVMSQGLEMVNAKGKRSG
jgi:hypothetical protein